MHSLIRTAGRALLIQDDQVLAVKYRGDGDVFYALPGGGQEPGEPLHENVRRECREELGIEVQVGDLAFVREWIDPTRNVHQIEFIFECSPCKRIEHVESQVPDGGQIGIEWLPIADLSRYCLYPLDMRELLQHRVTGRANAPVYLGSGA